MVISAYTDDKGYGRVRCQRNDSRKKYEGNKPYEYAIAVQGQTEPAHDRKGIIPGVKALDKAREAIAKFGTK